MEEKQNHPIPQDVTGFQFRLIGDMTVKQFTYLAGPSFLAWIFFQLPLSLLIKAPVSLVLGGIGASLAFLPIAGRPMDIMIVNFIKALFKSTIYIYKKRGMRSWTSAIVLGSEKINIQKAEAQKPKTNKKSSMPQISAVPKPTPQTIPTYSSPIPTQAVLKKPTPGQSLKIDQPQQERLEKDQQVPKEEKESKNEILLDLQKQLQIVLAQKEQLAKQLMALQQKLDIQKENIFAPTVAKAPQVMPKPKIQTQNVRQVPKSLGKSLGLPIAPEAPNIITGIIKDPRGNPLGNILVEIKDTEGNPVRAFKTNGLGQFASATPLTNGVYTISFDDPKGQNKFDAIEFTAKGEVILPLEAISIDTREELRKALFKEN